MKRRSNVAERVESGELMYNKFGRLVSKKKHLLGKKMYKLNKTVMVANRADGFAKGSRRASVRGSRKSRGSRLSGGGYGLW
jgi:hypothetical protein